MCECIIHVDGYSQGFGKDIKSVEVLFLSCCSYVICPLLTVVSHIFPIAVHLLRVSSPPHICHLFSSLFPPLLVDFCRCQIIQSMPHRKGPNSRWFHHYISNRSVYCVQNLKPLLEMNEHVSVTRTKLWLRKRSYCPQNKCWGFHFNIICWGFLVWNGNCSLELWSNFILLV